MEFSFNDFQLCSHFFFQEGRKASPSWGKLLVLICQVNRKYGCGLEQWAVMMSNKAMAKVLNKKFQVMESHERDHLGLAVVTLLRGNLLIVQISFLMAFLSPSTPFMMWRAGIKCGLSVPFLRSTSPRSLSVKLKIYTSAC